LGISLKLTRTQKGLSRKEVAAKAGVTEYAVEQIEYGLSPGNASIEDLERIAAVVSRNLTVIGLKVWRDRMTINTVFTKGGSFRLNAIPISNKNTNTTN
jgi:transcriptional regulator with XRE-family HTH domain